MNTHEMNTHEAINILRNTAWLGTNEDRDKTEQAIEVVAEALAQEPKRGKLIDNHNGTFSCSECQSWLPKEQRHYARYCLHCGIKMEIEDAPTIDIDRPQGEWIVYPLMDEGRVELVCPICEDTFIRAVDYKPHFCENCGARMESDTE